MHSNMWATVGLVVFVTVEVTSIVILMVDFLLWIGDYTTITKWVSRHPPVGIGILGWQMLGTLGLMAHFYVRKLS